MAELERLVSTNDLKTNLLMQITSSKQPRPLYYIYEADFDAFIALVVPPDSAIRVAHYVDNHVALLYRANDYEVIGIQVEAFQHSFVPKHPDVERIWRLSDSGIKLNFDWIFAVRRENRQLAEEIVKATGNVLGEPGKELAEAFELA